MTGLKEILVELIDVLELIKLKPGQSLRARVTELLDYEWRYKDLE